MENEAQAPEVIYGADVTWGNVGKDIVVSRFWEVYFNDNMKGPDEVINQISTIVIDHKINSDEIAAIITPDAELMKTYPNALVSVDGKWYDLNILDQAIPLLPTKSHRISIAWCPKALVETFLIEKAL